MLENINGILFDRWTKSMHKPNITKEILITLSNTNVKVISFTFDDTTTSFQMLKLLGSIHDNQMYYFHHPFNRIMSLPFHMHITCLNSLEIALACIKFYLLVIVPV